MTWREYVDSLASYKRGRPESRLCGVGKSRQQVPPDGASSLNPPRSPRFSDRYKHAREGPHGGIPNTDPTSDWYDPKDANESVWVIKILFTFLYLIQMKLK